MNIAAYFNPVVIMAAFAVTVWIMIYLGKVGLIRNAFDPFMLMHIQLIFTSVLLFWARFLPLDQFLYFVLTYLALIFIWRNKFGPDVPKNDFWQACVFLLVAISVPANLFLLLTKGFILFQEDVGAAKVEFYQGVGIIRRINTALSILLPIYVFNSWQSSKIWTKSLTVGLAYSVFIILSLGSKAGITSLAFSYGAVLYFQGERQNIRSTILILVLSVASSFGMFYLVYGNNFLVDLGVRIVAFADGPFYFFQDRMKIDVPFTYPFYIFAYAARLIDALPTGSLGAEINWRFFGFNDELYGPNPQISVESVAIFGDAAIFQYIIFVGFAAIFSRIARNPYSFALWSTFLRPFPVDSQLAYSNLYNIFFVGLIYGVAVFLKKYFRLAGSPHLRVGA